MDVRSLLRTLSTIEDELPALVGTEWPQLVVQLRQLVVAIYDATNEEQRESLAAELLRAFRPFAAAAARLQQILKVESQRERGVTRGSGQEPEDDSLFDLFGAGATFDDEHREPTGKLALPDPQSKVGTDEDGYEQGDGDSEDDKEEDDGDECADEEWGYDEEDKYDGGADEGDSVGETGEGKNQAATARERQINTWISERQAKPQQPLALNENYTLNFQVGTPLPDSLTTGAEAAVAASSVPAEGLRLRWAVISETVELRALDDRVQVATSSNADGQTVWTASFELLIPFSGDSARQSLQIIPRRAVSAGLTICLSSSREPYRTLSVALRVDDAPRAASAVLTVERDTALAPLAHLNLRTTHEWTSPPGVLNVAVIGMGKALVNGTAATTTAYLSINNQLVDWFVQKSVVAGTISNLRTALEKLRAKYESYFNNISPDDLAARLQQLRADPYYARPYNWAQLGDFADAAHQQQWDVVSVSDELRTLAYEGHQLYEAFFPAGTELRQWLDALQPGHRLNLAWHERQAGDLLPHIPWGLMYLPDLPNPGERIDATGFWGLRFRIEYQAHAGAPSARDLGSLDDARRLYFLYWGDQPNDAAASEARWQQQQFAAWQNQGFVPAALPAANPKTELLQLLGAPSPPRTSLLYLYCHCSVGDGNAPVLRFGNTNAASDVLKQTDFSTKPLADRPLVFANACTTSTADAYLANELEMKFFQRGCRAFIGTESKVPVQFASRFAAVFFQFFYRQIDAAPMAAGEALAQTRLQLWQQYRNLGGLFYSYVNAYDLFMADDAEVRALRF